MIINRKRVKRMSDGCIIFATVEGGQQPTIGYKEIISEWKRSLLDTIPIPGWLS